jgi:peptidyl-prolyl cis-trans isomerase D
MPSNDSNNRQKPETEVVKFPQKEEKAKATKKREITFTQIISYVILALITIVFIFGIFPSFGSRGASDSIKFGTYDGKPIEFAYGNYFYRQYQNFAQQNRQSTDAAAYQVWRGAFENTVLHTALSKMADDAGYKITNESVNQAIIESGIYDKDGKFDSATYENTSVERRKQINTMVRDSMVIQSVMGDIVSATTSDNELDYILKIGDAGRKFEYVVFDANLYPNDLTRQYALANPSIFSLIDIAVITVESKERAEELKSSIESGNSEFATVAKENSLDSFANEGGNAGVWYYWELQENFVEPEEVNLLFSTAKGKLSPVFSVGAGYSFYQVNQSPFAPDFDDEETLSEVKTYIGKYDADIVDSFLHEQAENFIASLNAKDQLTEKAEDLGLKNYAIATTMPNMGQSSYLAGFNYTDVGGQLSLISNDAEIMKQLYTKELGSIIGPIKANRNYLVIKPTEEEPMEEGFKSYLTMAHSYMNQSQIQQDLVQSIFAGDKLKDNFLVTFLEQIYSSSL